MDAFQMLGDTIVKEATGRQSAHMLGDSNPFDLTSLIDAASELSKKGVSAYESSQAADKKKKDQAVFLGKAIAADAAWADAEQQLALVQATAMGTHDTSQLAAAQALQQQASADAMNAGYGLDSDTVSKRVAAAQKAAKAAAQDSLANPRNAAKAALSIAWQKVASRASVSPSTGGDSGGGLTHGGHSTGGNWLTKHWGPLPVYGWIGVGVGTIAVGALVVHMMRK